MFQGCTKYGSFSKKQGRNVQALIEEKKKAPYDPVLQIRYVARESNRSPKPMPTFLRFKQQRYNLPP